MNSLKAYEILREGGFSDSDARAIANAIERSMPDNNLQQFKFVAAAEDLGKLERKGSEMEAALKQEMLRIESSLRLEIAESKSELLRWMFMFWVGQVGVTVAIFKMLR